jgi:hypothetical protein
LSNCDCGTQAFHFISHEAIVEREHNVAASCYSHEESIMTFSWRAILFVSLFLSISSGYLLAQGNAGLTGSVTDSSGAVIANAQVKITNLATGAIQTTTTGASGFFSLPQLAPGTYEVQVSANGFSTTRIERVDVVVSLIASLNVKLGVGASKQTVEVSSELPAVNTQDASIGTAFEEAAIIQLPLEGRNIAGLLSLQAGATYLPTNDIRSGSIQGSRSDQSTYTLDGVQINDPENQLGPYQTSLRTPLDSVQEFRTTTSNYGAELGGGGGAEVQLVSKTGSNKLHGSAYEYLRNTATSSNEYFNSLAGLPTPKLNKNVFGASAGGPIKKNRIFIFGNYEGERVSAQQAALQSIPSDSLRDGVVIYQCATATQCPGGTVAGLASSHNVPVGYFGLTPTQFAAIDPLGIGPDLAVVTHFQQYPSPNDPGLDGLNVVGFRFNAPVKTQLNTGVLRLDTYLDATGKDHLFWRGTIQDDTLGAAPQFPGEPPNSTTRVLSKGMVLGYDTVLTAHLINATRWGFIRPQTSIVGLQYEPQISFSELSDLPAITDSSAVADPTHEIRDDLTWTKGRHTLQFGGDAVFVRIPRYSVAFSGVKIDPYYMLGEGESFMPGTITCTTPGCQAVPAVSSDYGAVWAYSAIDLWGILSRGSALYNYTKTGSLLPGGAPVQRRYANDEYAWYIQDQWHARPTLTLTYGLRYNLYSPPWEVNGNQVCPTPGVGTEFNARRQGMFQGVPTNALAPFSYNLCGAGNGKAGFYPWDKTDFSPHFAAAWNPVFHSGPLGALFGDRKTVIRGGYAMVYDNIGQALATTYDTGGGAFGLSANLAAPFGAVGETTPGARFTALNTLPGPPVIPPAPPGGLPTSPAVGSLLTSNTVDNTIVTPHVHTLNFTIERELGARFTLQASYVGQLGRNLLGRKDFGMPLDLVDPKSGMDYYTAAAMLGRLAQVGDPRGLSVGTNTNLVQPIPYFEDLFPGAAGKPIFNIYGVGAASTATQTMYDLFLGFRGDYADALGLVDEIPGSPFYSRFGMYAYYLPQFCCYVGQSSDGTSNYNAFELSIRKAPSHGLQFTFNYTFSHSLDYSSDVERGAPLTGNIFNGGYTTIALDSWFPRKSYSNSDFDLRHQFNANWMYELPFGRGKWLGSDIPGWANQVFGGWQVSGLYRWTSGFPFNVLSCASCFTTNDTYPNNAVLASATTPLPSTHTTKNGAGGFPNLFPNASDAILSFIPGVPGQIGLRNVLRGDGYFSIDTSLRKSFPLTADGRQRLVFAWESFNLTNTPKFDTSSISAEIDNPASFGRYTRTFATCDGYAGRCMQFSLRYEF